MASTDVERFARRDWAAIEAAKARFWAEEKRDLTAVSLFALVDDFRADMRRVRPDWPPAHERDEDLAHHVRLSRALRRVYSHSDR